MTIAAGFNFDDGLLLCADTKHSGDMALYETKIARKEYLSGAKSVMVFSGSTHYCRMTIRKIESAINKLSRPSLGDMEQALEKILLQVHKNHIFQHPDRNFTGGPSVYLLVGLWSPIDGLCSYATDQTAVTPFYGYECVGSGNYLGHYIIRPRYHGRKGGLESVIFTALTALERIKRYDRDCGGYSDFVVLSADGHITETSQFDIDKGEEFSQHFYQAANLIYESIAQQGPGAAADETTRNLVEIMMRVVVDRRQELLRGKTRLEQLRYYLSMPSASQKSGGQS